MAASLERRLRDLEAVYTHSPRGPEAGGGGSGGIREFVGGVLVAIAHVRRALIDHPPHGYEIQNLRAREPWALAQYVAALTMLRHEDEDEARELLAEEAGDDAVLWSLIDAVVDYLGHSELGYSETREDGF